MVDKVRVLQNKVSSLKGQLTKAKKEIETLRKLREIKTKKGY